MNPCRRLMTPIVAFMAIWAAAAAGAELPQRSDIDAQSVADACKSLSNADFSHVADAPTSINEAHIVDAAGPIPSFCLAKGYVTPHVGIELRLPANWNGKFMEVGCGGSCGFYFAGLCNAPLRKGYACIASDMGHSGTSNDAKWSYNNLEAQIDWGYRAAHVTAIAGKAITEEYYRRSPGKSYFMGCSTGGREALVEAQRFPWDFDGIIAGAPVTDFYAYPVDLFWPIRALSAADGSLLVSKADMQLLHNAAVAQCDMDDGVKDGVIGNPRACKFDPASLLCKAGKTPECLTATQVDAVRKVYSGPPATMVQRTYAEGALPGSELNWVADSLSFVSGAKWMTDMYRYEGFWPAPGPDWTVGAFDFKRDPQRLGMFASLADASNPDLRKFAANGGKLIEYFGLQDPSPPEGIDYYETVERTLGGRAVTQKSFRLFLLPGVDHCTGGAGAFAVDYLSYLEAWVEKGQAPDKIIAAHINNMSWGDAFNYPFPMDASIPVAFTRPIFPYPLRAKYKGKGDPNDAANFVAVSPP
jgi:hypothetical protein